MLNVRNMGHGKSCHDRLCFAFRKELPQFFKRCAGQRLKRTKMPQQRVGNRILANPTAADAPRRITRMNRNGPAFRRPRSSATKEQLREYFEVRFRTEKYGVPYFLAESEAKQSGPRKEAAGARARSGRGFKWKVPRECARRGRRPFKPQTKLLHRRPPVGSEWIWRSQTRYRSDFKRTWVRLGERGRRDRPGARRGESLFSLIWIEISHKRFWELSLVSFMRICISSTNHWSIGRCPRSRWPRSDIH